MPTDRGYRFFVDSLMQSEPPASEDRIKIRDHLETITEIDELLRQTAKLLGSISHQLSIVSAPHLKSGVLEHLELIPVAGTRIFVVLTVKSGLVKTITMEVTTEISRETLEHIARLLNERIAGLTLETIRETFEERVKDFPEDASAIINLFIRSVDKIFDDTREREKLHIGGTQSLIEQPEFEDPNNVRHLIELLNNEEVIVDVLQRQEAQVQDGRASVLIGVEHGDEKLKNYSIIVSIYKIGDIDGSIAIFGPKRMNYGRVIPLIDFVSQEMSSTLSKEGRNG